jgi:hypothetical protein
MDEFPEVLEKRVGSRDILGVGQGLGRFQGNDTF